jgi:Flp pilus assembly pilin Flp
MNRWRRFLTEARGTTAVEYALILAAIILVAVFTIDKLGAGSNRTFHEVDQKMVLP